MPDKVNAEFKGVAEPFKVTYKITCPTKSPTIPTICSSHVSPLAVSTITPPAVDCIKIRPLALLIFFKGETDVAISPATVSKFLAISRLFKNLSLLSLFKLSKLLSCLLFTKLS